MCISCPTKKGIEKLPKEGTYYKFIGKSGNSFYKCHRYEMGINIIPQRKQGVRGKRDWLKKEILAGGHFFIKRKDVKTAKRHGCIIAKFKIKREDIEYIGYTSSQKYPTITAHKARRIE